MKIRLGTSADALKVAGYLKEMWLMHCDNEQEYVSRKKIAGYTLERIQRYLKDCFNDSGKSYLIIAEEENELIGLLKVNVEKIQSFFVEHKVLYLDDTYVVEKYRGRGVSKVLIAEAEKLAKDKKLKWLKTRIYEFNKPAQAMAKSVGLKPLYSEYFKILK